MPRELNFKRTCLTSIATRFKVGELIKLSFGPLAGKNAYFGIILSIRDSDPYCYAYEIRWINKTSPQVEEVDGELVETKAQIKEREIKDRKREQAMAKSLTDLIAVGKARGMNNPHGWAARVFAARRRG